MEVTGVIERVQQIAATRVHVGADRFELEARLKDLADVAAWRDAAEADIVAALSKVTAFPEAAIAESGRCSLGSAAKTKERADTLDAAPAFAQALDDADITAGHVDALSRGAKDLDESQRAELFGRAETLSDVAANSTIEQFQRRVRREVNSILADDGEDRLERQRRATSLSTWVDSDGMWNLRGRFDPATGVRLDAKLRQTVERLFSEETPSTCPSDSIEKQKHLGALALAQLIEGGDPAATETSRPARPEFVAVIDADAPNGDGSASVQWSIPVELPARVLAELAVDADVHGVVVRNGVVLHAPGRLDLGRSTRLANRAQRRALRGLYATCSIPGCATHYDRCKLHHVIWWRHGGRTDLDNLLPLCVHHHSRVHDAGWELSLGPRRELTIRLPDGTVRNTGPPSRRAA